MAFPIVAAALGLAAAGAGYLVWEKASQKTAMPGTGPTPLASDPARFNPAAPSAPVQKLTQNFGYIVQAVFDVKKVEGDQTGFNKDNAANYITVAFQECGFQVLTAPTASDTEMQKFLAGQPSIWTFQAKWLKNADSVAPADSAKSAAILNAAFIPIPAAV